jgi:hypothetical protein
MNSPFRDRVIRSNLRYMDWKRGSGGRPAFLDADCVEPALASGGLFARKVGSASSQEFLDAVDRRVFAARVASV